MIADSGATSPTTVSPSLIRVDHLTNVQIVCPADLPLQGPRGIAVDKNGNWVVADFTAKAVYRIDKTSGARTTLTSDPSLGPWGVTVVGPTNGPGFRRADLLVADADASTRTIVRVTAAGVTTPRRPFARSSRPSP